MTRSSNSFSRRNVMRLGLAAGALPLVHIRGARAAGSLKLGFWDHWVPGGNVIMKKQIDGWAAKNHVAVEVDFIGGTANQLQTVAAAEAEAKFGHDIMTFITWDVHNHAPTLEPIDDVMKELTAKNGAVNDVCTYLAKVQGHWAAVPTSTGTQTKPACARISVFKKELDLDLQAMYPVKPEHTALSDMWTYQTTFLKAAEACHKAGMTFGLGLGNTTDSVDWAGALFSAFGADFVDREGTSQVKSDAMREVLEYAMRLVPFLPDDTVSYDDASNNRALISGKSALIFNPPSAWAVAKRDAPQVAADCWTFPSPAGPKGRMVPTLSFFWGVWQFSPNKTAAKELISYLMQREQVEARCDAVDGYDIPPYAGLTDFKIWEEVGPPKGTVYNYPIRSWHHSKPSIAFSSAAPEVAVQLYNAGVNTNMLARLKEGQSVKQVVDWAQDQVEGVMR
jgi:ABC-type glycerol-3-phosphate transport system substrate-binding protein